MNLPDRVVIVTKKTALEEQVERFNTRGQARFYLQRMGVSFDDDQAAHDTYQAAIATLKNALPKEARVQWIERSFLPNYIFGANDLVVTLGPDGLVVNTAKYLESQPLLALNPDPARIDGVLLPFNVKDAADTLHWSFRGDLLTCPVTMVKAELNDGQSLLAVNDLFVGQRTHSSARYRLRFGDKEEDQSSSGLIVSTGAGSTGWFRSLLTGASGLLQAFVDSEDVRDARERYRFPWDAEHLLFTVREPFISRTSGAELVFGKITQQEPLEIISRMTRNGVIFSDGVEEDSLSFNSGAIAHIGVADRTLNLIVPPGFSTGAPQVH